MTERTPAGGDSSEIFFLDAEGNRVTDPEQAVEAEVREYAKGVMINRTYLERGTGPQLPQWTDPGESLGEPDAYDFAKNTWDVYLSQGGQFKLAETVPEVLAALGYDHLPEQEQRDAITNLAKLPSWRAAPQALKDEAAAWLGEGPPEETAT